MCVCAQKRAVRKVPPCIGRSGVHGWVLPDSPRRSFLRRDLSDHAGDCSPPMQKPLRSHFPRCFPTHPWAAHGRFRRHTRGHRSQHPLCCSSHTAPTWSPTGPEGNMLEGEHLCTGWARDGRVCPGSACPAPAQGRRGPRHGRVDGVGGRGQVPGTHSAGPRGCLCLEQRRAEEGQGAAL